MEIIETVAAMYQNGAKRSEIAREVGISQATVKKILISVDLLETKTSARVVPLLRSGMTSERVAAYLGITVSCVNANSPYVRQSYLVPSQTQNAKAIRKSRAKDSAGD